MNSLQYLLPVLLLLPIIIYKLSGSSKKLSLGLAQFLGPFVFIGFSILSYIDKSPIQLTIWNFSKYFSVGLKLDVLSGLIAATVSTIGIVVARYSIRFLEDDPKSEHFKKNLAFTLSFVFSMLLAPNLVLFSISWAAASYFLHKLLTHFSNRQGAIKAARQKFWINRLGDIFIVIAGGILLNVFKTLEFNTIFAMAENTFLIKDNYILLNTASIFLVLGAMTKSAQFPFHHWLPNTMETPTPVSAIMHAGIINAGGYLIIRMAPFLSSTPLALSLLAIIGSFTAFWATIVMFTQVNVKKNLAYSTIAQMGFMMLQCGLGAFSIATVHIIGHAFYKAYAFLSSGTATDFGRLNRYFPKQQITNKFRNSFLLGATSIVLVVGSLMYTGVNVLENPGVFILLIVLALAASQMILNSKDKFEAVLFASSIVLIYLGLTNFMTILLEGIVPANVSMPGIVGVVTVLISAGFFIALYLIQNSLDKISQTEVGKQIYVKALRGGF